MSLLSRKDLVKYFADWQQLWLLAVSGSVILALDIWILLVGLQLLVRTPKVSEPEAPFQVPSPSANKLNSPEPPSDRRSRSSTRCHRCRCRGVPSS